MLKEIKEIQRQIEIAAMVYEKPNFYSEYELSEVFKTSPTTIRRDLKALRTIGADIHSRKNKLVAYFSIRDLNKLISSYYAISSPLEFKNLTLLKNKFKEKTLSMFINILKAIRDKHEVQLIYRFSPESEKYTKIIYPIYLIDGGKSFYLITYENHDLKIFRLETLEEIKVLKTRYKIDIPPLAEIFRNSWGIYTGGEEINAILKFNRNMDGYVDQKQWMTEQEVEYVNDGIIIKIKVKLSYEFVSWVMGWGDKVEVIAPVKLKEEVLRRASSIIKKYNESNKANKRPLLLVT